MDLDVPRPLLIGFSAVIGLIIGSFLNVVVARLPHGQSLVRPGSRCPSCQTPIRWWMNVPVLSYVFLRGRCAKCAAPISIRYPLIELLTGALFVAVALKQGASIWLPFRYWPFVAGLVAITFIDLEHRIIPDELSWGGMGLGLATAWWDEGLGGLGPAVMGAFLGFGVFYFFAWAYWKATGRHGLGGGDIKLLGMLGAFLGPYGVFTAILVSSVLGSVFGIAWALAARKGDLMKSSIPFGPFLVVGGLYYYLLGEVLWLPFTIPT